MEIITSTPPHSTKSQNKRKRLLIGRRAKYVTLLKYCINKFISLSLTHRVWGGGGGIIQEQDEDADCTFIQGGQVPTFKGANVHPLI